jgi:outer membrane receptor protein involved in Fe transport
MVEFYAKLSTNIKGVDLGFNLGLDPDYFNNYGRSTWTEVTVGKAVTPKLYASGGLGHQHFFQNSSTGFPGKLSTYTTWNAGVSYSVTPRLTLDVRYYDNDTKVDLGRIYKPRGVITLRRTF